MNEMSKIKRNPAAVKIANEILKEYDCDSVADMQDALKEIFGPLFEGMLQGEMDHHLGYKSNSKEPKSTKNRRNGSNPKTLKTSMGEVEINTPRDRDGSFEPVIVPKRSKDVSNIEGKVLSMYARGMSQRDISSTIEDIYGFKISHDMVSDITNAILPEVEEWQNRPLKKCYPFVFVDCMYVSVRNDYEAKEEAVYVILGYDLQGQRKFLACGWILQNQKTTGCRYLMKSRHEESRISSSFLWMAYPVLNPVPKLFSPELSYKDVSFI